MDVSWPALQVTHSIVGPSARVMSVAPLKVGVKVMFFHVLISLRSSFSLNHPCECETCVWTCRGFSDGKRSFCATRDVLSARASAGRKADSSGEGHGLSKADRTPLTGLAWLLSLSTEKG